MQQFVLFPDRLEQEIISRGFFEHQYLPGILGCVDGTQVKIYKPCGPFPFVANGEIWMTNKSRRLFYNRKGTYSINVMVFVDNNMKIRFFSANHPGSCHDARIYNESRLKTLLEASFDPNAPRFCLGDKGYGNSNVLITPFKQPRDPGQVLAANRVAFNVAHSRTRSITRGQLGYGKLNSR